MKASWMLIPLLCLVPACSTAPNSPAAAAPAGWQAVLEHEVAEAQSLGDKEFVKKVQTGCLAEQRREGGRAGVSLVTVSDEFLANAKYAANARSVFEGASKYACIVGGKPDTAGEFPDCVAVGSSSRWCCSGTLIAYNAVLSAGHCEDCSQRVFFGNNVGGIGQTLRVIRNVPACEQCGAPDWAKDLRVLILEHDVTLVSPRSTATASMMQDPQTKFVRLAGFGATVSGGSYSGIKYKVDVPLVAKDCTSGGSQYGCHESEFVAGKPLLGQDSCNGDSGGPAYLKNGTDWFLIGATSRMTIKSTHDCGDGGIYVRVDEFNTWLHSIPDIHWADR